MSYEMNDISQEASGLIMREIMVAMSQGHTKAQATLITSTAVICVALGFASASMGKQRPSDEMVYKIINKLIDEIDDLPSQEAPA